MKAVLEEMAQLAAQAGNYFSVFFDKSGEDVLAFEVWLRRYVVTGEWVEKHFGLPHDRKSVVEMEAWLLQLKAQG